jgi:hypothetical protein
LLRREPLIGKVKVKINKLAVKKLIKRKPSKILTILDSFSATHK